MRPLHLKIAASMLIVISLVLVIRSRSTESGTLRHSGDESDIRMKARVGVHSSSESSTPPISTADLSGKIPGRPSSMLPVGSSARTGNASVTSSPSFDRPTETAAGTRSFKSHPTAGDAVMSDLEEKSIAAVPVFGIQLADDVRLPVAAMPPAEGTPESSVPPVVAEAAKRIVDDFYRDLAAGVTNEIETRTIAPAEDTVVIGQGQLVDNVREDADQIYRAIYGKAAFNRQKMNAVLEARQSTTPVTGE